MELNQMDALFPLFLSFFILMSLYLSIRNAPSFFKCQWGKPINQRNFFLGHSSTLGGSVNMVFFLKNIFLHIFLSFFLLTSFTWASEEIDSQRSSLPSRSMRGIEVTSADFFYLSFTPIFEFFGKDEKAQSFLDVIALSQIRQQLERLAQMSQDLLAQMPSLSAQIQEALEKNQLAAVDSAYQAYPPEFTKNSFLLIPLSEEHLRTFRDTPYGKVFNHSHLDARIEKALKKVIDFGFFPAERKITLSQNDIAVLFVLNLIQFFNIEGDMGEMRPYEGGDGSKHFSFSKKCCFEHERYRRDHLSAREGTCWCLNLDKHLCYLETINKIHSLLYGMIQPQILKNMDDDSNRFWTDKRKLVGVFDDLPYYERRGWGYHPKSEFSRFREIYQEARKTYEEIKKSMTIDFIDQEINTVVKRHARCLRPLGYTWEFYPAYEKLSHFKDCIEIVLRALFLASKAEEDFNREGSRYVNVLGRSCSYRAKLKDATVLPTMLKELEYLIRIPYSYDDSTSQFLKRVYLTYEDDPVEIFYWKGSLV